MQGKNLPVNARVGENHRVADRGNEIFKKYKIGVDKQGGLCYSNVAESQSPLCGCSSMVEHQPSKLVTWVRFPSPAPLTKPQRIG